MSDNLKKRLISIGITFISTFLTIIGTSIATMGQVEWTTSLIGGILIAAVRAAFKAVLDRQIPIKLGGKKIS